MFFDLLYTSEIKLLYLTKGINGTFYLATLDTCINIVFAFGLLYPPYTGTHKKGVLANIEDPDDMPHSVAFHQGLHCLIR